MSADNTLVFDPAKTATTGAQGPATINGANAAGGGNIAGAGTYYSLVTVMETMGTSHPSETLFFTGTLAGTLTVEVDDSPSRAGTFDADIKGNARWQTYDKIQGGGFTNGVATLVAGTISGGTNPGGYGCERPVPFARIRLKAIITGGAGTIESRRLVKGYGRP